MIKLVCLINRPAGIAQQEFHKWWLGHHAKVAARLPGLRRYTISLTVPQPTKDCLFDGVAELWFDTVAAMAAAFDSPEGQECAREDREFIGNRVALITEEHVIVELVE